MMRAAARDRPARRPRCRLAPRADRRSRWLLLLSGALAIGALASCTVIWGVDDLSYRSGGAGGHGAQAGEGQGAAAATGGAGGSEPCEPGSSQLCYTGPEDTENVGPCHGGTRVCNDAGTGYGPCEGEVVPSTEICGNETDEDCDGAAPFECLNDRDLVARYFIDEAATGQAPTELTDAAADPLPLPITYGTALGFDEVAGNRGLRWQQAGEDCGPSISVSGTKVRDALNSTTAATIEIVARVEEAHSLGSPLFYVGVGSASGYLALHARSAFELELTASQLVKANWNALVLSNRTILHLVIDTNQSSADDRVRLYADGSLVPTSSSPSSPFSQGEMLTTAGSLAFGDRPGTTAQSLKGTVFYLAIYAGALNAEEVAHNATLLTASDDTQ